MSSTDKVLGTIGAINTLLENFPMNILDISKGKTYTSAFDFMIDVLNACGVSTNEIIQHLVKEIYAFEYKINEGVGNLEEQIVNADFTKIQESKFLSSLEEGMKYILMGLLSSVYGCSSIPILPNKFMDYPNKNTFPKINNRDLWDSSIYPLSIEIPIKMIDIMGMLEITPTTIDGRIYYDIDGNDTYYRKTIINNISSNQNRKSYLKNIPLYLTLKENENIIKLFIESEEEIPENLDITIGYLDERGNNLLKFNTEIKISEKITEDGLIIVNNNVKTTCNIEWIKINGNIGSVNLNGNIKCFLSYDKSINIINNYNIFNEIIWGDTKKTIDNSYNDVILGNSIYDNYDIDLTQYDYNDTESINNESYTYIQLTEVPDDYKTAVRMSSITPTPNEKSPDLIVVYNGINPNELYKTYDLNAFIWYVINKSSSESQLSINRSVWDSRYSSLYEKGISNTNIKWNQWYASKSNATDEFKNINDDNSYILEKDSYFPILQLKKSLNNLYNLNITFPSQTYFKPIYRKKILNNEINKDDDYLSSIHFNSSIYKFNWDYLNNIQILKPKILLTGLVNYLLGFSMSALNSIEFNKTKKIIEKKLSSAITKIIEADDMEIEDCYMSFSNEEFDDMMEEMLLSRYTATHYGGEINKIKQHDVSSYMAIIDSINKSATKEESITKLTKLINDVLVTPGNEGSINYGIDVSVDPNLLKKLLWAITMPIVQSLFTPQVMLLLIINMNLTGAVKIDEFGGNDFGKLLNLLMNKILGLTKSIVKFVKDAILELLFSLLMTKLLPLIIKWAAALQKEKNEEWLLILYAALNCLPKIQFGSKSKKTKDSIDDVRYADIINTGTTTLPESASPC